MAVFCTKTMKTFITMEPISEELKIKTHYESLDIAQSNRIHYICFSLPPELPAKEIDEELKQVLKDEG